jgi:hypothetical protein
MAWPRSSETRACSTPGIDSSTFFTLCTQPWQVMPPTFNVISIPDVRRYAPARQRFSNSELPTTDTDDNAIAAPAITGLSSPRAAIGMPRAL